MFYRWYMTPTILAKISIQTSNICWKCKQKEGTFYHMWWTCKDAQRYWSKVNHTTRNIRNFNTDDIRTIFIKYLARYIDSEKSYLTIHIITAARIVFAKHWKEPRILQIDGDIKNPQNRRN